MEYWEWGPNKFSARFFNVLVLNIKPVITAGSANYHGIGKF